MLLHKWNREIFAYDDYEVPNDWNVRAFSLDMGMIVNCPHCGREVLFGDCFTSHEIHTQHGMGYAVCGECYDKEWEREEQYRKEKGQNDD